MGWRCGVNRRGLSWQEQLSGGNGRRRPEAGMHEKNWQEQPRRRVGSLAHSGWIYFYLTFFLYLRSILFYCLFSLFWAPFFPSFSALGLGVLIFTELCGNTTQQEHPAPGPRTDGTSDSRRPLLTSCNFCWKMEVFHACQGVTSNLMTSHLIWGREVGCKIPWIIWLNQLPRERDHLTTLMWRSKTRD